jgi:hypothetical protein
MSLTKASYSMITGAPANVLDYGAVGNGIANDTNAFNLAIATGKRVYVPAGTYKCNAIINNKTIIYGDGSTISVLKPYDTAIAVLTYNTIASVNPISVNWNYHSEIRDLGFESSTKTGVGFTFAVTDPADYATDDEYKNNVKFYGCNFTDLEKGVQFPCGNIGTEFYSCGFSYCKYGVYAIDAKFGGLMQAGNKYFYAGEFHRNDCAFYCNNVTDGFGAIKFDGTVLEANKLAFYIYSTPVLIVPIQFNNVWFETNSAASVTIDSWSGTTVTPQTVTGGNTLIAGDTVSVEFNNSFFSDCQVTATNSTILVNGCRSERDPGFTGKNSVVTGAGSTIYQNNCYGDGGPSVGVGTYSTGYGQIKRNATTSGQGAVNWINTVPHSAKITGYGPSLATKITFESIEGFTGVASINTSVVSDGIIYATCGEFTRNNTSGNAESFIATNSTFTTAEGYYVATFDAMRTAGAPECFISDLSGVVLASSMYAYSLNKFYSFATIGYSAGTQTLSLGILCPPAPTVNTIRLSAFQILRFDTYAEAQNFLNSGVYVE